jgi:hypothetical protein
MYIQMIWHPGLRLERGRGQQRPIVLEDLLDFESVEQ